VVVIAADEMARVEKSISFRVEFILNTVMVFAKETKVLWIKDQGVVL
jgi:hypothetical protein